MKKKKILFLGKLPPPYIGPTIATKIILNSNLKDYFEIIHLDTSDHRDINTLGKIDLINFLIAFKQYFQLVYYIIRHKPDAVYFPTAQTTIAYLRDTPFVIITKLFRKKLVGHLRGGNFKSWYNSTNSLTKFIVRRVHPLFNAQIVLGNNLKYMFYWLLPEEKIFVVPNGRNFTSNNTADSKKKIIDILFLANFIKSKGLIDTLNSVKHLSGHLENIKFNFAGNWIRNETKREFYNLLKEIDSSKVNIIGPVIGDEKIRLLERSDIFILPTYYHNEGHPWVIIEAMAAGLPIISTDQGAITESVFDGVNGFIVEKQNPKQIAEKLKILIENPELRIKMGKESRRIYEEKFTEEKMVNNLSEVFNKIME